MDSSNRGEELEYTYKTTKVIAHAIVQIVAIITIGMYGVELARAGIDHIVPMLMGSIIGGIAGYSIKGLQHILSKAGD